MGIEEFNKDIVPMRSELRDIALKMTGNEDESEDFTQEVLLKLWSIRDTLDQHSCHKALAITILKNKINDRWRHRQLEREMNTGKASCIAEEDNTVENADEVDIIRTIIDTLPNLQQTIFRMKEIEGYEQEEIMKITGCSPDSLRQNLSRARKRIRSEFIRITAARTARRNYK